MQNQSGRTVPLKILGPIGAQGREVEVKCCLKKRPWPRHYISELEDRNSPSPVWRIFALSLLKDFKKGLLPVSLCKIDRIYRLKDR